MTQKKCIFAEKYIVMKKVCKKILQFLIYILSWFVFRPKIYYYDGTTKKRELPRKCILICNHNAHIDGVMISAIFYKYHVHCLAAKDRFEQSKFLGWFLYQCDCIPIDRKNLDTTWIHDSLAVLAKNEPVCIFPEGLRSKDRTILPFHSGVTTLAYLAKVPVVPIYIDGPYTPFLKRFKIMVGEPYNIEKESTDQQSNHKKGFVEYIESYTNEMRDKILELQKKLIDIIE